MGHSLLSASRSLSKDLRLQAGQFTQHLILGLLTFITPLQRGLWGDADNHRLNKSQFGSSGEKS